MSRVTPPDLVESIKTLAAEGLSQATIARRLDIRQPRVSKIMRSHTIVRRRARSIPVGPIAIAVQILIGGRGTERIIMDATAKQLRDLADYREALDASTTPAAPAVQP
jgi:transcriptional regulator with XRE-family HTH domain